MFCSSNSVYLCLLGFFRSSSLPAFPVFQQPFELLLQQCTGGDGYEHAHQTADGAACEDADDDEEGMDVNSIAQQARVDHIAVDDLDNAQDDDAEDHCVDILAYQAGKDDHHISQDRAKIGDHVAYPCNDSDDRAVGNTGDGEGCTDENAHDQCVCKLTADVAGEGLVRVFKKNAGALDKPVRQQRINDTLPVGADPLPVIQKIYRKYQSEEQIL